MLDKMFSGKAIRYLIIGGLAVALASVITKFLPSQSSMIVGAVMLVGSVFLAGKTSSIPVAQALGVAAGITILGPYLTQLVGGLNLSNPIGAENGETF